MKTSMVLAGPDGTTLPKGSTVPDSWRESTDFYREAVQAGLIINDDGSFAGVAIAWPVPRPKTGQMR